jgi:adenylate cyclase
LIDVASQAHLWSEDYDRDLTDVFAVQSDVAQHVAQALQITLRPAEATQIAKAGTDDLEAYNAYLKGLITLTRFRKRVWRKASSTSSRRSRAIRRLPKPPPPWRYLTICWVKVICRWTKLFRS